MLVSSEEEEDKEDKWVCKNDISEYLFKKKMVTWLRDKNLKLTAFDNISNSSKNLNDDNIDEIDNEPSGSVGSP